MFSFEVYTAVFVSTVSLQLMLAGWNPKCQLTPRTTDAENNTPVPLWGRGNDEKKLAPNPNLTGLNFCKDVS